MTVISAWDFWAKKVTEETVMGGRLPTIERHTTRPVNRTTCDQIIKALAEWDACPKTTGALADMVFYSRVHVRQALRCLALAGEIVQEGGKGQLVVWSLPRPVESKRCRACGVELPVTEFHRDRSAPSGRKADCRHCLKAAVAGRRRAREARVEGRRR